MEKASPAKPIVVPYGDEKGRHHDGNSKCAKVDLRWLREKIVKGHKGMGGAVCTLLPGMAELTRAEVKDAGEGGVRGYELLDEDRCLVV